MTMMLALLLVVAQETPPAPAPPMTASAPRCVPSGTPPSRRIARLLSSTDGSSAAKAYRVRSIREEYQILEALGLCPDRQSLRMNDGHPYDVVEAVDAHSGEPRVLWFDIRSFF